MLKSARSTAAIGSSIWAAATEPTSTSKSSANAPCRRGITSRSVPGAKPTEAVLKAGLPADVSSVLYKMDFAASAKDKDRILAEWKQKIER